MSGVGCSCGACAIPGSIHAPNCDDNDELRNDEMSGCSCLSCDCALYHGLKAERDELRAENERLKRLFKQRGKDAAEAEAEIERLKDMNERIRQSFEEFRRAPWSVEVERLREQRDSAEQCANLLRVHCYDAAIDAFYETQSHCGASDCEPEPYVRAAVDAVLEIVERTYTLIPHTLREGMRVRLEDDE